MTLCETEAIVEWRYDLTMNPDILNLYRNRHGELNIQVRGNCEGYNILIVLTIHNLSHCVINNLKTQLSPPFISGPISPYHRCVHVAFYNYFRSCVHNSCNIDFKFPWHFFFAWGVLEVPDPYFVFNSTGIVSFNFLIKDKTIITLPICYK